MLERDVRRVAIAVMESLSTPFSLHVKQLIEKGDWDQIASLRIDPTHYEAAGNCGLEDLVVDENVREGALHYYEDQVAASFLRKFEDLPSNVDKEGVALAKWKEAEQQCCLSNVRFSRLLSNHLEGALDIRADAILQKAKDWIRRVLGPIPQDIVGRFGPGSCAEISGKRARHHKTVPGKMSQQPLSTPKAKLYFDLLYKNSTWLMGLAREFPYRSNTGLQSYDVLGFVPKDATTDRSISIGPGVNVFLQLGIGEYIRERLKRLGLDLDENQDLHRRKAREGSLAGLLATIDLSSASDTIARKLVEYLLPSDWFTLLDDLRCHRTHVLGDTFYLEKFSSMGNGFTFELETLIFASICFAAGAGNAGSDFWVYGDDIIIPTESYREVTALLQYCGFTPNRKKSFCSGSFRESCGGDYFLGYAVRPYFLKESLREPNDFIALLNGLSRCSDNFSALGRTVDFSKARKIAYGSLPSNIRCCVGPAYLGDAVIHEPGWESQTLIAAGIRYVRGWVPTPGQVMLTEYKPEIQLAAALAGNCTESYGEFLPFPMVDGRPDRARSLPSLGVRDFILGYHFAWLPAS